MRHDSKFIIVHMVRIVPILLFIFLTAGCAGNSLIKVGLGGSASETSDKPFSKVNIKEWQERLPIQMISIYPNQSGLARFYGEVQNNSNQELELVKIIALNANKKPIGAVTVESLGPRQSQTFDIQTAVPFIDIEDPAAMVSDIRIKGKP